MRSPRSSFAGSLVLQYGLIVAFAGLLLAQTASSLRATDGAGVRTVYHMDFIAFYCAGATLVRHGNPYESADYDRCGDRLGSVRSRLATHIEPAPIPAYDIAFFSLLSRLPFALAVSFWLLLSAAALLLMVPLMSRLSGVPPLVVFAAIALQLRTSLQWGQLPAIVMGTLVIAAFAITRSRWNVAAFALTCSMLEPHIGLAACVACLIWLPPIRVPLVAGLAALAVIGVLALGVDNNVLYVTKIVPLQILAETPAANQFSLTWILYWFGAPDAVSARLGSISYGLMLALGVVLAKLSARELKTDAAIPLIPIAAAVLGGPFIHSVQISVATLAALLVAGRSRRFAAPAWLATIGLAVIWSSDSWYAHKWNPSQLESALLAAAIAGYAFGRETPARTIATACGAAIAFLGLTTALMHVPRTQVRIAETPANYLSKIGGKVRFTTGVFGVDVRRRDNTRISSYATFADKAPAWASLILLLATISAVGLDGRKRRTRGLRYVIPSDA